MSGKLLLERHHYEIKASMAAEVISNTRKHWMRSSSLQKQFKKMTSKTRFKSAPEAKYGTSHTLQGLKLSSSQIVYDATTSAYQSCHQGSYSTNQKQKVRRVLLRLDPSRRRRSFLEKKRKIEKGPGKSTYYDKLV